MYFIIAKLVISFQTYSRMSQASHVLNFFFGFWQFCVTCKQVSCETIIITDVIVKILFWQYIAVISMDLYILSCDLKRWSNLS